MSRPFFMDCSSWALPQPPEERVHDTKERRGRTTTLFVLHLSSLPLAFCQQHSPPPHSLLLPHSFKSGSVSVCMSVAVSAISFLQVSNNLRWRRVLPATLDSLGLPSHSLLCVPSTNSATMSLRDRPCHRGDRPTATYRLIVTTPSHGCPRHNIGSNFSLLSPPFSREPLSCSLSQDQRMLASSSVSSSP